MMINLCLACRRVNAPGLPQCAACGAALDEAETQPLPLDEAETRPLPLDEADTQPLPLDERPHPAPPGALWLADLTEPGPAAPPAGRAVARAPLITLRDVVSEPPATPAAPPPLLVAAEPAVGAADAPAVDGAETRRLRRAERRAEVRRARLRALVEGHAESASPPEVLVLHGGTRERDRLCVLLRRFGFGVHVADGADQACALAASPALVAAFVGIDTGADADAGLIDCRRLRERCQRDDGSAVLLVGVVAAASPIDVVRAELAGCDELIVSPTSRGSVARVFDLRGIALPADARRA